MSEELPVPKVLKYDISKKKYPFEILIIEKFTGEILSDVWNKINKKNQIKIVYELGKIMARINSIKFNERHSCAVGFSYSAFNYFRITALTMGITWCDFVIKFLR